MGGIRGMRGMGGIGKALERHWEALERHWEADKGTLREGAGIRLLLPRIC